MPELDWREYPDFYPAEFKCRGTGCCGGLANMHPDFMRRLQLIRDDYGKPMVPSSGFRCEEYNQKLRGGPEHPMGMAADFPCTNPDAAILMRLAVKHDMPRLGISQRKGRPRFIHIGGSHELPEAVWCY